MSAVLEALDLDEWIVFSTEGEEPCEAGDGACPFEPVALAVFEILVPTDCCDAGPAELRVCVLHRDDLVAAAVLGWPVYCRECGAAWRLLRMEPVR